MVLGLARPGSLLDGHIGKKGYHDEVLSTVSWEQVTKAVLQWCR